MSQQEPPPPQRGATGAERDRYATDLERQVVEAKTWPEKLLAAASPKLYFGMVKDYPAGIKQFLWLCLGILYPFWLVVVAIAWPVIMILRIIGRVLFEIWWFCTGWFWRRLGGEKPGKERRAQIDAERQAKIEGIRTERYQ